MSCRGKAAAAIVKEPKMPRISNASLIAALSLVPAALAGPASAFVQLAETLDSACHRVRATRRCQPEPGSHQGNIFDAPGGARDLRDGLIQSGMKLDRKQYFLDVTLARAGQRRVARNAGVRGRWSIASLPGLNERDAGAAKAAGTSDQRGDQGSV